MPGSPSIRRGAPCAGNGNSERLRTTSGSVATDAEGNVYLSGFTEGSLGGPYRGGRGDAWVAKYSAGGALRWKRQLGTSEQDWSAGVATDDDGNIYISGKTGGSLGGASEGIDDAFVAKYFTRR